MLADRLEIQPGDRVLLIAEDDPAFGSIVCEAAHRQGLKCLLTSDGYSALTLVNEYQPDAIILDISLPNFDGWRLLDRLKSNLGTRHIPVTIISASEESQPGLKMGCFRFCTKPVPREQLDEMLLDLYRFIESPLRHVLALEDDPAQQMSIAELIGNPKIEIMQFFADRGLQDQLDELLGGSFEKIEDNPVEDSLPLYRGKERWQI